MQRFMRKYRNYFLVFILLVIGLPMLFFGIPSFMAATVDPSGEIIGHVGDEVLYESALRRGLDNAAQRFGTKETPMTYADLAKAGHADKVMEEMIDFALINIKQNERPFAVTDNDASVLMKSWKEFQDEEGNFNQKKFEDWRDLMNERGMNWNALYEDLHTDMDRQVFMNVALAAAYRVTDEEVEKELNKKFEKLRVRYTKVTLPVYLTDADIQAYYDSHQDNYKAPDQRFAQFIAVSIAMARPTKADEVFKALAEGQDFAAVADTFSDLPVKNGGELGWQTPLENEEPHRQKLFALGVGEVSDLVLAPQGYFIYKVEEERTNPETNVREVKARQIFLLNPSMSETERNAQSASMSAMVAEANSNGIDAAATKYQLPVGVSGGFDKDSVEIENIPRSDATAFRDKLKDSSVDMQFISITGRENNYCAKVTEVAPGLVKPLEEVREQVIKDAKSEKSKDPEFKKRIKAYAYKIGREIKTLEDIKSIYPDVEMEIIESQSFGSQDNLYQQGVMVIGGMIFDALDGKEIGQAAGPIEDFTSEYYFVELLERIPPTEEDKAKFEEERKTIRDNLMMKTQTAYFKDYRKKLRDSMLANYAPDIDQVLVDNILGINQEVDDTAPENAANPGGADASLPTPTDSATPDAVSPASPAPVAITIPTPESAPTATDPAAITIPTTAADSVPADTPAEN